jgi:hypothetical protein
MEAIFLIIAIAAIGIIFLLAAKKTAEPDDPIEAIDVNVQKNRGALSSKWQTLKATHRNTYLEAALTTKKLLYDHMQLEDRVMWQFNLDETKNEYELNFHSTAIKLIKAASEEGLDVPTFLEKNRYMLLKSVDLQETAILKKLDYQITRSLRILDIQAQQQLKILEVLVDRLLSDKEIEQERKRAELKFEGANRLDTADVEVVNKLTEHLFKLIEQRDKENHPDKDSRSGVGFVCFFIGLQLYRVVF